MDENKPSDTGQQANSESSSSLVRVLDQPPSVLPTIVLEETVPFPGAVIPLLLDGSERREVIHQAKQHSGMVLLINRRHEGQAAATEDELTPGQVHAVESLIREQMKQGDEDETDEPLGGPMFLGRRPSGDSEEHAREPVSLGNLAAVGVVARLVRVVRLPDERLSALLQLFRRAQPAEIMATSPILRTRVNYPAEVVTNEKVFQALLRQVRLKLQTFFEAHPSVSDELKTAALAIDQPNTVADFVAQHLSRDARERQAFLSELDLTRRLRHALEVTVRELDLLTVGNRISQEIRDKVEKHQRDFLLREQLKSIRAELGEEKDPAVAAVEDLKQRLKESKLPETVDKRAQEELRRLSLLPSESPEYNTLRSYLEVIAALPWSKSSEERHDIQHARQILDADHFGLKEVKDRIVEFLAVHQLNPKKTGTLMCFSGPPGVGKTSLGQSIARALGREFYRFSVGGMRDEAEIKGHRRTYVGAMPGRILQGLKQVQSNNPVFMLDELDKIGNDWRGDPSSALLEVLDPAQNGTFTDHYLDLPFDLSKVMFIATVNIHTEMPGPLRDRLEIIDLPGYIPDEKREIGRRYLLPRQRREHGLKATQLKVGVPSLNRIITGYTHEAGVRELERQIAKICRKRALAVVSREKSSEIIKPDDLKRFLGPQKINDDRLQKLQKPGVAVGLAWTAGGGDTLFIETVSMTGKGDVKITGQLGDVMSESAKLAFAYVRHHADKLGIDTAWFSKNDVHLHFPAGAVRKDGPSAGITVTTALVSLMTGKAITPRMAMTGEMTLRGEVLPVGGIREKVVAARRAGIRHIILPARNRADVEQIPPAILSGVHFTFAADFSEVLGAALPGIETSGGQVVSGRKKAHATGAGTQRLAPPKPARAKSEPRNKAAKKRASR